MALNPYTQIYYLRFLLLFKINIGALQAVFYFFHYYCCLKLTLGVSNILSCGYSNLLVRKNFHNLFTIDCAIVLYHYEGKNIQRKVATTQLSVSAKSGRNRMYDGGMCLDSFSSSNSETRFPIIREIEYK